MEKSSRLVKIISVIISLFFTFLAFLCLIRVAKSGSPAGVFFWFLSFAVLMSVPSYIATQFITYWASVKTAGSVYWPGDNVNLLPPDYSDIRSHIVKGDYYKAIEKLEVKIEEEPENHLPVALLSDIYIDHLTKYGEAITILSDFLNRPERSEQDIPFVMKLVDILLEIDEDEKAERLLNREMTLSYSEKDKELLSKRKNGLNRNS